jgi:ABC-type dipeptide/oligopeptide/nickel transport system permease component
MLGQCLHCMAGALHGDFGTSVILRTGVGGQRVLPSLLLIGYSLLLALAISIPLAVVAATKCNR